MNRLQKLINNYEKAKERFRSLKRKRLIENCDKNKLYNYFRKFKGDYNLIINLQKRNNNKNKLITLGTISLMSYQMYAVDELLDKYEQINI